MRNAISRPDARNAAEYPVNPVPVSLPVWVGFGNHDRYAGDTANARVRDYVRQRMGPGCGDVVNMDSETTAYSFNWGRLHLIQLHELGFGTSGGAGFDKGLPRTLQWLTEDLARYAKDGRPVIVFQHYALSGADSKKDFANAFGTKLLARLAGYNVIALFAGHDHEPRRDRQNGIDIFTGSTGGQHEYHTPSGIHAVRVTSSSLDVAFYQWCQGKDRPTDAFPEGCPNLDPSSSQGSGPRFNAAFSLHKALAPPTTPPSPSCGGLRPDERLSTGQSRTSCDGRFTLVMQGDGNLVLYQGGAALWATNTNGPGNGNYSAVMQGDGNFVVYRDGSRVVWASNTERNAGASLAIQNDGNVVVYAPGSRPLWASNTCCR